MSIGNSPEDDRPSAELSADASTDPSAAAAASPDASPDATAEAAIEADRPSVGHTLRRARIDAGLTVDEVSGTTRVRAPIIHAIEQDDFSRCGGDVYARGHIRTLARAVGLDPALLLDQYDGEHGGRPAPTPAAPLFEAERIRPERRRPNWTAAMVAAIVAVIGFVGFTLFSGDDSGQQAKDPVAGGSPSPKPEPTPTPAKPADPKPDPAASAIAGAPKNKVTVLVSAADDRSWISAKDHNGRLMFDGLLKKGESKSFTDKQQIDLVLGNAGAIKLFVNGKEIKDEFKPGQVERLSYTKDDPEDEPGVG
ncbi:helix-turn-helix domain-containing protein [Streptomyces apocyni]|uniref:helix-turn-helix domain-containing protein n=1 Tax=Streptomyces apocyni TaxID=2654677 RepID=UPI001E2A85FC|nr:helix-turn-helix domain-containing protein [Streptomyces apocyni]